MPSRRAFVTTATKLVIGGAAVASVMKRGLRTTTALAASDGVRTIHLEPREVTWELAPGKRVKAMAYNGQIPGPEIRAREGERLRIVVRNALSEATTVHWHGVDVPNPMDGVPGVTQQPIQPGETFVYEFAACPPGTRWYHTHAGEARQLDLGLAGPFVIEPAVKEALAYDREVTLVLDDWATGTGTPVPDTDSGTAGARGSAGGMMGGMGGMMGRGGMGSMMRGMMGDTNEPAYDVMTINGKAYPATEPMRFTKGERVRLRIVNASAEHTHVVRLAGHRLRVTHTDGNPLAAPVEVDALPLAPAERYDVLVTAEHPGAWFLYCTQPGHAAAGERMLVLYEDHARNVPPKPDPDLAGLTLWNYALGRGRPALPKATSDAGTFPLTLSGGMMGGDVWTINGKVYPRTDPIACAKDSRVRLVLRNMSMEAHPMHLHGQSFRVLAVNGARFAEPLVKDVVDVEPHMGSAVIEVVAANPGSWLFHCHKLMHMMGGMMTLVKVG